MGDYFTNPVRHPEDIGVGHIRRTISLAEFTANGNRLPIGALEAGAIPRHVDVYVEQAFNAGTSNALDVGTSATPAGLAAAAGTLVGAIGWKDGLKGTLSGIPLATDQVIYATYTPTGTAPTTGKVAVCMTFTNKREVAGAAWPQN